MFTPTAKQVRAAVQVAKVVFETIKAEGDTGCPSSVLYLVIAELGGSARDYTAVVDALKASGLIVERDRVLYAREHNPRRVRA